jgi:hypothetical protein
MMEKLLELLPMEGAFSHKPIETYWLILEVYTESVYISGRRRLLLGDLTPGLWLGQ